MTKPPSQRIEDVPKIEDDLDAALACIEIVNYARARERQAMNMRDERLRAANGKGTSMGKLAKATGLSYPMMRLICRPKGDADADRD